MLAELREAKFAAEEQQDRVTGLQADLAAAIHQAAIAQQSNTKLQEEALVHSRQQQHLLDELSQSQVAPSLHYTVCCTFNHSAWIMHSIVVTLLLVHSCPEEWRHVALG